MCSRRHLKSWSHQSRAVHWSLSAQSARANSKEGLQSARHFKRQLSRFRWAQVQSIRSSPMVKALKRHHTFWRTTSSPLTLKTRRLDGTLCRRKRATSWTKLPIENPQIGDLQISTVKRVEVTGTTIMSRISSTPQLIWETWISRSIRIVRISSSRSTCRNRTRLSCYRRLGDTTWTLRSRQYCKMHHQTPNWPRKKPLLQLPTLLSLPTIEIIIITANNR